MLVAQAKESAEWFSGQPIESSVIERIHGTLRRQMENIILIGMPGCGKSTVGKLIAKKLGMEFKDADKYTEEIAKMPIPEIFANFGEDAFRGHETNTLYSLGMQSGLVIATGGGCVTKPRNYPLLHQNGTIFWLKRDTTLLPTEGRPLSQQHSLEDMYQTRKPLYESFADHIIDNNGDMNDTLHQIIAIWEDKYENPGIKRPQHQYAGDPGTEYLWKEFLRGSPCVD